MASSCKEGVDEQSFMGDGSCLKPVETEGSGTIDGRCMAEADDVVVA